MRSSLRIFSSLSEDIILVFNFHFNLPFSSFPQGIIRCSLAIFRLDNEENTPPRHFQVFPFIFSGWEIILLALFANNSKAASCS